MVKLVEERMPKKSSPKSWKGQDDGEDPGKNGNITAIPRHYSKSKLECFKRAEIINYENRKPYVI
jgi:hypothetical protein